MKKNNYKLLGGLLAIGLACLNAGPAFGGNSATWVGNPDGYGYWGEAALWNPSGVPDGTYDVTIPLHPTTEFSGPTIGPDFDASATVNNLTVINRSGVFSGNLTVLGTTALITTPGHDGEYGILSPFFGTTYTLGNLTNFSASILTGGYIIDENDSEAPTILEFNGADVIENRAFIYLGGANSIMRDQVSGLDALRNLAVNEGSTGGALCSSNLATIFPAPETSLITAGFGSAPAAATATRSTRHLR
jgi:hypothetical protein